MASDALCCCRCDNCIIQTMIALQFLACICNIVACLTQNSAIDQAADLVDLVADIVWCAVCGCMQVCTSHCVSVLH